MESERQRSIIARLDVPYKIRETGVPQSKYIDRFSSPVRLLTVERYKYMAELFPGEKILQSIYFYLGSYKSPLSSIFNVYCSGGI